MKILLLGDVVATDASRELFEKEDVMHLFGDTKTLFENCDFSIVNLECALTDSESGIKKFGPCLKSPIVTASALKKLGVDCCCISNNHIFDFGKKGAQDTMRHLHAAGVDYTGFGENYEDARKNYYIDKNGERVCIIAVCEKEYSYALEDRMGARPFDEFDTIEDVRAAKAECDRVIVLYHGGKELCRYPSPRVYTLCRALVRNGADLVIGQHSHCIATYEEYQGGHILHGQGNFHFVMEHSFDGWHSCLAVEYDSVSNTVSFVPISSGKDGVRLSVGEEKEAILKAFYERNAQLQNGEWREGWHAFCLAQQKWYTACIAKAGREESTERENAFFAHYLDCQAHTDVWRELFPTYNMTNEK